jgi:restriction system protein
MNYFRNHKKYSFYRSNHYPDRAFNPKAFLVIIGILLVLGLFTSSPGVFTGALISLIILFGVIFLIVLIIKRLRHWTGGFSESEAADMEQNISQINCEKHKGRCYAKGLSWGEQWVANILAEGLSYKDYYIFNNLTIPSTNNGSSQIDHLVISKFGIFVIENKDYKGWIFGNKDQENWTQSLPGGENKFQFQNPIRQNWSHIMALKELFPIIPEKSLESIVVFTNTCEIKTFPIEGVIQTGSLIEYISKFKQEQITEENMQIIIGKLSLIYQIDEVSLNQHIDNLNSHHTNEQ